MNTKTIIMITKRLCLLVIIIFNNKIAISQYNLVNNPSFEEYVTCPNSPSSPPPKFWYMPTNYTGFDYSNSCSNPSNWGVPLNTGNNNYQYAKTGGAYIYIFVINFPPFSSLREYYQTKLKDSLKKNKNYFVEFYAVFSNDKKLKCNNISALLTKTAVYVDTVATPYGVLYANPQITNYGNPIITDTLNWVKVSGIYKAEGGEQYLTLGNFKDDAHTNYFASQPTGYNGAAIMIDDVSVIPLDSFCLKADAGKDTTITLGDSVFIGSYTNGLDSVKWLVNGTTLIDSIRPGFWVKPTVTTTYLLQQTINGCFSADTVVVNVGAVPLKFIQFTASPTPPKEGLNNTGGSAPSPLERAGVRLLWQTANEINVKQFNIQRSANAKDFTTIGTIKANNKASNEYNFTDDKLPITNDQLTLYYRLQSIDNDGKKQYSVTRTLNIKPQTLNNVFVYPNPAKDYITIECKDGIKEIKIINQLGQVVQQMQVNKEQLQLDVSQLHPALYLIKIVTQKNVVYNEKFIKQ